MRPFGQPKKLDLHKPRGVIFSCSNKHPLPVAAGPGVMAITPILSERADLTAGDGMEMLG